MPECDECERKVKLDEPFIFKMTKMQICKKCRDILYDELFKGVTRAEKRILKYRKGIK